MTDAPLTRSVRLIFELASDGAQLLEQHQVDVTVGLCRDSHTLRDSGDYVEVRDRDGRTLSRVPVRAGLGSNVGTFPQDPYISSDVPRVLTVVVPAAPDADDVAVVRTSARPTAPPARQRRGPGQVSPVIVTMSSSNPPTCALAMTLLTTPSKESLPRQQAAG